MSRPCVADVYKPAYIRLKNHLSIYRSSYLLPGCIDSSFALMGMISPRQSNNTQRNGVGNINSTVILSCTGVPLAIFTEWHINAYQTDLKMHNYGCEYH